MYSPWPRIMRGSSLRLTEWPMPPIAARVRVSASVVMSVTPRSTGRDRRTGLGLGSHGHLGSGLLDALHDVHVPRTATEVAADPFADLGFGGIRVLAQEPGRLHDHPWGAEAA